MNKIVVSAGIILFAISFASPLFAADEILWIAGSKVNEVKLYPSGALVNRTAQAQVKAGNQELVLQGLSPYIDQQSISVKVKGEGMLLNVRFQNDYLKDQQKPAERVELEEQLDSLQQVLSKIQNRTSVLNETQTLLLANKSIGGANTGVVADELELMVEYFSKKLAEIKDELNENALREKKVRERIDKVKKQMSTVQGDAQKPDGNIIVQLQSEVATKLEISFSYYIPSYAGWTPFYDIRVNDVSSPVEMIYKARLIQQTGEDWENVMLTLSTGNPSAGGQLPELQTWNLYLREQSTMLNEVQIKSGAAPSAAQEQSVRKAEEPMMDYTPVQLSQNQLSSDFEIKTPYTLRSDGKELQAEIQKYSLQASYRYRAIPKLDADAFLTATIGDWSSYSLSPGEANVYFDGTFVGQSYVSPYTTDDSLQFSLGRDQGIIIRREQVKDFTHTRQSGAYREKSYRYEISLKNIEKTAVKIWVDDQVPISQDKDIEVRFKPEEGMNYDPLTGKVSWEISLAPGETKKVQLNCSVRYPKNKVINL